MTRATLAAIAASAPPRPPARPVVFYDDLEVVVADLIETRPAWTIKEAVAYLLDKSGWTPKSPDTEDRERGAIYRAICYRLNRREARG